jgi:hypothetical protein
VSAYKTVDIPLSLGVSDSRDWWVKWNTLYYKDANGEIKEYEFPGYDEYEIDAKHPETDIDEQEDTDDEEEEEEVIPEPEEKEESLDALMEEAKAKAEAEEEYKEAIRRGK